MDPILSDSRSASGMMDRYDCSSGEWKYFLYPFVLEAETTRRAKALEVLDIIPPGGQAILGMIN